MDIKRVIQDYEKLEDNQFWEEFNARVKTLMDYNQKVSSSIAVDGIKDLWQIARSQGAYEAYRTVLGLPNTIISVRQPEGPTRTNG